MEAICRARPVVRESAVMSNTSSVVAVETMSVRPVTLKLLSVAVPVETKLTTSTVSSPYFSIAAAIRGARMLSDLRN